MEWNGKVRRRGRGKEGQGDAVVVSVVKDALMGYPYP